MGAWIEIDSRDIRNLIDDVSHPTWVRGLKFDVSDLISCILLVAPYMGAWIEILIKIAYPVLQVSVAPYMGAWIEI